MKYFLLTFDDSGYSSLIFPGISKFSWMADDYLNSTSWSCSIFYFCKIASISKHLFLFPYNQNRTSPWLVRNRKSIHLTAKLKCFPSTPRFSLSFLRIWVPGLWSLWTERVVRSICSNKLPYQHFWTKNGLKLLPHHHMILKLRYLYLTVSINLCITDCAEDLSIMRTALHAVGMWSASIWSPRKFGLDLRYKKVVIQ